MEIKKRQIGMIFSIFIIGILLSMVTIEIIDVKATLENEEQETCINTDLADWEWTTTNVISTESTDNSDYPSLAVDAAGNVHIVWEDITNYDGAGTDPDIFYKYWDVDSSSWSVTHN